MLQATTIRSGRKIALTTAVRRLLFDPMDGKPGGTVFWHYYNDEIIAISNQPISHEDYSLVGDSLNKSSTDTIEKDDSAIHVPKKIREPLRQQFEQETQTVAEFIATWVDLPDEYDEADLADGYRPETGYFDSCDELEAVLNEEIAKPAFFLTIDDMEPVDLTPVFLLSQEQMRMRSPDLTQRIIAVRDITDDPRVFAALREVHQKFSDVMAQFPHMTEDMLQANPEAEKRLLPDGSS